MLNFTNICVKFFNVKNKIIINLNKILKLFIIKNLYKKLICLTLIGKKMNMYLKLYHKTLNQLLLKVGTCVHIHCFSIMKM